MLDFENFSIKIINPQTFLTLMKLEKIDKAFLIIFIILLPILLILFSYKLAILFTTFDDNQQLVLDYLNKPLEFEEQLVNNSQPAITELELSHLNDVEKVMNKTEYFFLLALIVCSLLFTQHRKNKHVRDKMLLYGGIATVALSVILILFFTIGFEFAFNIFHQIFFPQGNWIFPEVSFLITTFPLNFFIAITTKILIINIILGSFFIAYHWLQVHLQRKNKQKK